MLGGNRAVQRMGIASGSCAVPTTEWITGSQVRNANSRLVFLRPQSAVPQSLPYAYFPRAFIMCTSVVLHLVIRTSRPIQGG